MDSLKRFHLFTSNRMEELSAAFCRELLSRPSCSPLHQETVVVQSSGMMRWLSMETARITGVCANIRFFFPNRFLQEVLARAFGNRLEKERLLGVEAMTWAVMSILEQVAKDPQKHNDFSPLLFYIEDGDIRKRYQLASRIADTFDQYMVFRPDMIIRWEKGKTPSDPTERWQARLWRMLAKESLTSHRAALWTEFFALVEKGELDPALFPRRVFLFGISSLPPLHLQILKALSSMVDVCMFSVNPCREYWLDALSPFELAREEARLDSLEVDAQDRHLGDENPLLASMGTAARDFFSMVCGLDPTETELFSEPDSNTMLGVIQNDILENVAPKERLTVCRDDCSIKIFSCHGPMREVEVLHDNLLEIFEKDPALGPENVLVMAPDIEVYAPYIKAVFESRSAGGATIPFTITDRTPRSESPVVKGFMALLSLFRTRFEFSAVLEILELPFVRQRFGISEAEFLSLYDLLLGSGARWGIDEEFRKEQKLPGFRQNTWKAAIDNLVAGFAMAGDGKRAVGQVLPVAELDGNEAGTLEKFISFFKTVVRFYGLCVKQHTPASWRAVMEDLVESMFEPDDSTEHQFRVIGSALGSLAREAQAAGYDGAVPLEVVSDHLEGCFSRQEYGASFIHSGVTFCSMLPMRSIPFPVIYLLGMNMDDYPRKTYPPGFDITARAPRRGDRSKRNDDRCLFLETILSARKKLYISYVGRDASDNSPRQPSVLVSELCDYISERFVDSKGRDVLGRITVSHRLQPFNPQYFLEKESGLFSYASEYRNVAAAMAGRGRERALPWEDGLESPDESWRSVEIGDLCAFFKNPARFFLSRRLGISLPQEHGEVEDSEPFTLDPLSNYNVSQRVLETVIESGDLDVLRDALRAAGTLPHGKPGDLVFENIRAEAESFAQTIRERSEGVKTGTLDVRVDVGGFSLLGRIDGVCGERWLRFRFGSGDGRYLLANWICHLAMSAYTGKGVEGKFITKDGVATFKPVSDPKTLLEKILKTYWDGLSRPLPLFPKSSFVYADALSKGGSREAAVEKAASAWHGGYNRGEKEDRFYTLCFGKNDPLGKEFMESSEAVFSPLIEHLENEKL